MKLKLLSLLFSASLFSFSFAQQHNALSFDGVNDYVDLGNIMNDVFAGANKQFTIEAWVKIDKYGGNKSLVSKYANSSCSQDGRQFSFSIMDDGKLGFTAYGTVKTTFYRQLVSTTILSLNTWTHVAVTYNGVEKSTIPSDRIKLYINGIEETTTLNGSSGAYPFDLPSANAHLSIGSPTSNTGAICSFADQRFAGSIDELRIWDTLRSCGEIYAYQSIQLQGTENGIAAYYDFNNGNANQNNNDIDTLIDLSPNNFGGTLTGFALTKDTSNWIGSGVMLNPNNNVTTFDCSQIGITQQNALSFDGVNDYVDLGNIMNDVFAGANKQFTIEAWVKIDKYGGNKSLVSKYANSSCSQDGRQFSFSIMDDGKLGFTAYGTVKSTIYRQLVSTTILSLNTWTHVAVTYNGIEKSTTPSDRIKLYINGIEEISTLNATSGAYPFDLPSTNAHLSIGSASSSTGAICSQTDQRFKGSMDELRIWDTLRSCGEIYTYQSIQLQGTENGIAAYYDFNSGYEGQNNTMSDSLFDLSANNNRGSLINFALLSTSSNWVSGVSLSPNNNVTTPTDCELITSTTMTNKLAISVFPTLAEDFISISSTENISDYSIVDYLGNTLDTGNMKNNKINVSTLNSGVYFLILNTTENKQTLKFIKN